MKNFLRAIVWLGLILLNFSAGAQTFLEKQKIVTLHRESEKNFGHAVDISGQFAAISTNREAKNSVYIFQKNGSGNWIQIQEIISPDNLSSDAFGYSIDLENDNLIIGDYKYKTTIGANTSFGAAYIYKKNIHNQWSLKSKLISPDNTVSDFFGQSVSIFGRKCLVGAKNNDFMDGAVYVFEEEDSGVWHYTNKLKPSNITRGYFGTSLYLSDSTIISGALREYRDENENNPITAAGAVYVYELTSDGTWKQKQKIVAYDRQPNMYFGAAIAVKCNLMMISSGGYLTNRSIFYNQNCAVYMYEKNHEGIWEFTQKLSPPKTDGVWGFGNALALNRDYLVVASMDERENKDGKVIGLKSGAVYIYTRQSNGNWVLSQRIVSSDLESEDFFGRSVSLKGNQLMVGAFLEDHNEEGESHIYNAGSVYTFEIDLPTEDTISKTNCGNYYWQGNLYEQSGIYEYTTLTKEGCDSTIVLHLTILPNATSETSIISCNNYIWNNNTYNQSGTYSYHNTSVNGCDSIETLQLTINENFKKIDSIITDSSYIWPINGITYESSGEYEARFTNTDGCDSIHFLVLRIESKYNVQFPNIITGGTNVYPFRGFSRHDNIIIKELSIYDRMASRVYHIENTRVDDPNYGWNGTFRDMDVVPGVYVWMVELIMPDGSTKQMAGDVTIIR